MKKTFATEKRERERRESPSKRESVCVREAESEETYLMKMQFPRVTHGIVHDSTAAALFWRRRAF
jgi:hypothetical protein